MLFFCHYTSLQDVKQLLSRLHAGQIWDMIPPANHKFDRQKDVAMLQNASRSCGHYHSKEQRSASTHYASSSIL
jgi:hypothetical protein